MSDQVAPFAGGAPPLFLSYSTADRTIADEAIAGFQAAGVPVFCDRHSVLLANVWQTDIVDGLKHASKVVLLLSKWSTRSRPVNDEVTLVLERGTPLQIVRIDNTQIPPRWRSNAAVIDARRDPFDADFWRRVPAMDWMSETDDRDAEPKYIGAYCARYGWRGTLYRLPLLAALIVGQVAIGRSLALIDSELVLVAIAGCFSSLTAWRLRARSWSQSNPLPGCLRALPVVLALVVASGYVDSVNQTSLGNDIIISAFLLPLGWLVVGVTPTTRIRSRWPSRSRHRRRWFAGAIARVRRVALWGWTARAFPDYDSTTVTATKRWLPTHIPRRRRAERRPARSRRRAPVETSTAVAADVLILFAAPDVGLALDLALHWNDARVRLRHLDVVGAFDGAQHTVVLMSIYTDITVNLLTQLESGRADVVTIGSPRLPDAVQRRQHITADGLNAEAIVEQLQRRRRDPLFDIRDRWMGVSEPILVRLAWCTLVAGAVPWLFRDAIPLVYYAPLLTAWSFVVVLAGRRRCDLRSALVAATAPSAVPLALMLLNPATIVSLIGAQGQLALFIAMFCVPTLLLGLADTRRMRLLDAQLNQRGEVDIRGEPDSKPAGLSTQLAGWLPSLPGANACIGICGAAFVLTMHFGVIRRSDEIRRLHASIGLFDDVHWPSQGTIAWVGVVATLLIGRWLWKRVRKN